MIEKVTEGRWLLPIAVLYAVAVWLISGLIQNTLYVQFAFFAVTAYLMVEMNNRNALIRIYSSLVAVTFIIISGTLTYTFTDITNTMVALCSVASILCLFNSYQDGSTGGWTYYGFLFVGISSLFNLHVVFFVPVLWILMATSLYSMSLRTFVASLLGLITPYWFGAVWVLYCRDYHIVLNHFSTLLQYCPIADPTYMTTPRWLSISLLTFMGGVGAIHYLFNRYEDKIRNRMLYDFLIVEATACLAFIILQPIHFDCLIWVMAVTVSPLIAHCIAFVKENRLTMAFLLVACIITLTITICNIVWTY